MKKLTLHITGIEWEEEEERDLPTEAEHTFEVDENITLCGIMEVVGEWLSNEYESLLKWFAITDHIITYDMIKNAYDNNAVRLIVSPNEEAGTVCWIGNVNDYGTWFYFGGQTAEDLSPDEWNKQIPMETTFVEIIEALEGIRDEIDEDEYEYCYMVVNPYAD